MSNCVLPCPVLSCPSLPCQLTSVQTSFMGTETFNIYLIHCPKVSNCHLYFLLLLAQQNVPTSFVYQAEINSCYVQLQTMGDWNLTANIFYFFLFGCQNYRQEHLIFPWLFNLLHCWHFNIILVKSIFVITKTHEEIIKYCPKVLHKLISARKILVFCQNTNNGSIIVIRV